MPSEALEICIPNFIPRYPISNTDANWRSLRPQEMLNYTLKPSYEYQVNLITKFILRTSILSM